MHYRFADRLSHAPKSFLDELFRVLADPSIISFAGGLPSSALIDTEGIRKATCQVMEEDPATALQYTTTDGYLSLREFIADRYRSRLSIPATATEIQIVNGSQQCLDLFAKIFLNTGDHVGMERHGYLGAIEAFSLYAVIDTVALENDGPDLAAFERLIHSTKVKFFYGIPTPRILRERPGRRSNAGQSRIYSWTATRCFTKMMLSGNSSSTTDPTFR